MRCLLRHERVLRKNDPRSGSRVATEPRRPTSRPRRSGSTSRRGVRCWDAPADRSGYASNRSGYGSPRGGVHGRSSAPSRIDPSPSHPAAGVPVPRHPLILSLATCSPAGRPSGIRPERLLGEFAAKLRLELLDAVVAGRRVAEAHFLGRVRSDRRRMQTDRGSDEDGGEVPWPAVELRGTVAGSGQA